MSIDLELADISPISGTLLTIGVFDGVHLGHQHLLKHLIARAREQGLMSGVVTFKSHPQSALTSGRPVVWLNSLDDRIKLIKELGIDITAALSFTRNVKELGAGEFIEKLRKAFNLKGLIVGPDFALGRNREGDIPMLKSLGKEAGFSLEVMPPFVMEGETVRSSGIRKLLAEGDVAKAARFLGRPFMLKGEAIRGQQKGRTLGFPTVNLELNPAMAAPRDGVYATITRVSDSYMPSVTNIGIRPTFGGGKRIKETHILNFDGDLLGRIIEVSFISRLRDEKKFDSEQKLKEQIARDVEEARKILTNLI